MPLVTIKTGLLKPDGSEEVLTEYLCDWPDCPNIAVHQLAFSRELRAFVVVCAEHAQIAKGPSSNQ